MITFHPTLYFRFCINHAYWLCSIIIKINYHFSITQQSLIWLYFARLYFQRPLFYSIGAASFLSLSLLYEDLKSRPQVVGNFKVRSQSYIHTQIYNGQRVCASSALQLNCARKFSNYFSLYISFAISIYLHINISPSRN